MFRFFIVTLIVAFAVAATTAAAQHVKTYKFGPSTSQVSAPHITQYKGGKPIPTPGPTTY